MTVLEVRDLRAEIRLRDSTVRAVDGVSLQVGEGETVGLVGESGCGKTMLGTSVIRLLPPGGRITGGQVLLEGRDLTQLTAAEMRKVRGSEIGMVFQDPMTSLDPTMPIGRQIAESVQQHKGVSRKAGLERAAEVLALVGMPRPAERLGDYPHQLSGGLRQRVMIAMALANEPKLLIADEPTTALDVTIQAQILDLLDSLKQRLRMAVILITHDLGVIAERADNTYVMYAGQIVEHATTVRLFDQHAASLHRGAAGLDPEGGPGLPARAVLDPRPSAGAHRDPDRMPLRVPLPVRPGGLPRVGSGARRPGPGP